MYTLQNLKSIIYRVRWGSVIALLLLVALIYVLLTNLPGGYQVGGGIGIWAQANPSSVQPGDTSTIEVEMKNMDSDKEKTVFVRAITYDQNLFFDQTYAQTYQSEKIKVGPQEVRKISFILKTKPTVLDGRYRIDIKALEEARETNGAESKIFFDVKKE